MYQINIEKFRELKGDMTVTAFAVKCKISKHTMGSLFKDDRGMMDAKTLLQIADTFKIVDVRELLIKI